MNTLIQDIRYSVRVFRRSPGVSVVIVLTLALGIGVNSVVYSMLESMFLRPLPFRESGQLVVLGEHLQGQSPGGFFGSVRYLNYVSWREQCRSFESMGAYQTAEFNLSTGGRPDIAVGRRVDPGYFAVLGVRPRLGRSFLPEEFVAGKSQVALLSYDSWQRRFGGSPDIIGQSIKLQGTPYLVIGVMSPSFRLPAVEGAPPQFWVPFDADPGQANRETLQLQAVARLKPAVSIEQAREELTAIARRLEQQYPDSNKGWGVHIEHMQQYYSQAVNSPLSLLLLITVNLILLIACSNAANILLARGIQRGREIAIRTAVGATRKRLVRQFLTESLLLSILGGGLGVLIAGWTLDVIRNFMLSHQIQVFDFQLDLRVAGATVLLSLMTGLIFGLLPAWRSSRVNLSNALKEGAQGASAGISCRRVSRMLVIAQVTLSLVLLVSAGVAISSMIRMWQFDWGFALDKMLTLDLALPDKEFVSNSQRVTYFEQLVQRMETLPGVQSVALTNRIPIGFSSNYMKFKVLGRPAPVSANEVPTAAVRLVNAGYFQAFSVHVKKGRALTAAECFQQAKVALINETTAKRFWQDQNPLGMEIEIRDVNYSIVGIISDKSSQNPMETPAEATLPYTIDCPASLSMVIQSAGDPVGLMNEVRRIVGNSSPEAPVFALQTMEQVRSQFMIVPGFVVGLLIALAGIALALATVGVFGLLSYFVSERTHEIGVRMALGAPRADVLLMVLRQGMALTLVGAVLGLLGGFALTRILVSQVYWMKANVPLTCAAATAFLLLTALFAFILPARRAAGVNPISTLRFE